MRQKAGLQAIPSMSRQRKKTKASEVIYRAHDKRWRIIEKDCIGGWDGHSLCSEVKNGHRMYILKTKLVAES